MIMYNKVQFSFLWLHSSRVGDVCNSWCVIIAVETLIYGKKAQGTILDTNKDMMHVYQKVKQLVRK